MRLSEGIEWAIHCCTVLAVLPDGAALPASRLAEFHGVPPAYLGKQLQALGRAGVVESVSGRRGGFRLARPAAELTLLDVVQAIDGAEPAFRCTEIRQRGPTAVNDADAYRRPCTIAAAMWRAEAAWRRELEAVTIADLTGLVLQTAPAEQLTAGTTWISDVLTTGSRR